MTPKTPEGLIPVQWRVSDDPGMRRVLAFGIAHTNASWDYTVKVDVTRLNAATTTASAPVSGAAPLVECPLLSPLQDQLQLAEAGARARIRGCP